VRKYCDGENNLVNQGEYDTVFRVNMGRVNANTLSYYCTDSHTIVTRQIQNLHFPQANLTIYQKGVYYAGIKMFNNLPIEI
jgi:hypothetical protein